MIVPMKKVTVLCLDVDQNQALEQLRGLGVVHLEHIQTPAGTDIDEARALHSKVARVLDLLPAEHHAKAEGDPRETVEAVWGKLEQQKKLQAELDALRLEQRRVEPYGSFDPELIKRLAAKGVYVTLCKTGIQDRLELPEGVARHVISETKDGRYVAAFSREPIKLQVSALKLPEQSLSSMQRRINEIDDELVSLHESIVALGSERKKVETYLLEVEDRYSYAQAKAGMGTDKRIAFLRGYCPDESMTDLQGCATTHGWGLVIEEPGAEDRVPTEIRSPKWVQPIKTILDVTGIMPGYDEVDVSPVFLIALSIFFAMLVGDAGYGALFLLLTFVIRRKMKKAPAYPFSFMYIMSVSTIVWGVITGTYFGITRGPGLWYMHWFNDDSHVMFLCFIIGAVHISVAHLWNAWLLRNSPQAAAHIGWVLCTWTMFYAAGMFVLARPFPAAMMGVFGAGLLLIVLFMTPAKNIKAEWFNHVMLPLTVINNFTDVVSYLRLFAVGTASFAVANSFNQMLLADGWGAPWAAAMKAILLFGGHALNIALCGLGILVHGVRLNTLEFSSHMGLQWKGHKYLPFTRKAAAVEK